MKVLIIDDENDIRRIARLGLGRVGGMEVLDAGSGALGLALAQAEHPDAVLLDVMMPGMDGPTTLQHLRANPETRDVPVVFLTAKAMTSEIERLLALGARAVLTKPFDPMTLAARLRDALGVPQP